MVGEARRLWSRERPLVVLALLVLAGLLLSAWQAAMAPPPPAEWSASPAAQCRYDDAAGEVVVPVALTGEAPDDARLEVSAGVRAPDGTDTGYTGSRSVDLAGNFATDLEVRVRLPGTVWERGAQDCWISVG